ncbi:putative cell polarity [Rosellinia necatrix]|uniref:Putative cell polarity n=1 Tax=Rosellinia necatrix TaxID=77044 RepID=A0A1W2TBP7_ROSNE|nr:putative cell polarity [Rosellinia necatrix]
MNTRNAPLSPVSIGGSSEWSGTSKYQADGLYPNNRGLVSPPDSGSPGGMMNGFPGGPRSVGGPSPPPSVGRSSTYARSESGRSIREENTEPVLGEHYVALRRYLAATSKDGRANPPPNKARDKLLRLSSVQFLELSTDVFDELMRRQIQRPPPGAPPNAGPPPYLQPEANFHPKRNQARQKLSTLGSPRFRDLATDVFCELERRIPAFVASVTPRRSTPGMPPGMPPSRTGTPVNGMGLPRGPNGAMRRPSDASSIRSAGPPRVPNDYPMPASPVMPPNGNFDRPLPKQFQSNTIVPNKSTMVEEDDDGMASNDDDHDAFAPRGRDSKASMQNSSSEVDKRLIDDYRRQVEELRARIDSMGTEIKKRDEELVALKDAERSQTAASDLEKKEWDDKRKFLEGKLADAESLNTSIRDDLERLRDEHAAESRALREELEEAHQDSRGNNNSETSRENEELRLALQEQQQVTEEARREARQFLEEMRTLSQQHTPSWEKQAVLERTVEQLETEIRDWRNRYARTKTQLRNMRASSIGLTLEANAGTYIREKGFADANGLVKDVHVTKFQISIDELLRCARTEEPERVIDCMKSVIVNIRRITKDIDDSQVQDEELMRQQQKLKNRVSATANNLITASKNFASAAGLSPVSLVDAAASHLVAALVELLRTVKIRATPAAELEDDDDGSITPVESTGFLSNRTTTTQPDAYPQATESPLAPPPTFQGLRAGMRDSTNSSAYSPYNSPRGSLHSGRSPAPSNGQMNGNGGMAYNGLDKGLSQATNGYAPRDTQLEDLKIYLEDQTAIMVQTIQGLVGSIRGDASIQQINEEISSIADVVSKVVAETETTGNAGEMLGRLSAYQQRLLEAGDHGNNLAARGLGENDREWRMWAQTLPPIAFEIVRQTKDLIQHINRMISPPAGEDFS